MTPGQALFVLYHDETERFDRLLPHVVVDGVARPLDKHSSNAFARKAFDRAKLLCAAVGEDWNEAFQCATSNIGMRMFDSKTYSILVQQARDTVRSAGISSNYKTTEGT